MPYYESQPVIYPLHRLLQEVLGGEIRVPRFQRPGTEVTWRPAQRGDLLDSIFRGYPVGTILLWSTTRPVRTISTVGGAEIPQAETSGRPRRLLLDGHQRLSTLIALLGPGLSDFQRAGGGAGAADETWVFDVGGGEGDGRSRERFVLLKAGEQPGAEQIPLGLVLDRVKLNAWVRDRHHLTPAEVQVADALRDRLREYGVPVVTLVAEKLSEATESFKRINSSGVPMSDFHMVTALAYADDFDPQAEFDRVREGVLAEVGWQDIDHSDILRVCAGLVRWRLQDRSQHPAKFQIDGLGTLLQKNRELIERAGAAIAASAGVLRQAGIRSPEVLPYAWQMIVLAIVLGTRDDVGVGPGEMEGAISWFWRTTYGNVFAGANTAVIDRARAALEEMLAGRGGATMRRDEVSTIDDPPERFDYRSVRCRACVLNMARFGDLAEDGPLHRALVGGAVALAPLEPGKGRSCWYNLVIEPDPEELKVIRKALRSRAAGQATAADDATLARIGILEGDNGTVDDLLLRRRNRLLGSERRFVESRGLQWRVQLRGPLTGTITGIDPP